MLFIGWIFIVCGKCDYGYVFIMDALFYFCKNVILF